MVMLSPEHLLLRLGLATLLGGLVGMERGMQEQSAGLRTHAMVALGASLFMVISSFGFNELGQTNTDLSRVAAQVVSGIGFLGAGAIIQQRQSVRGLTTAASIWAVAAIGLAVGGGLYLAAAATTALILFLLTVVKPVERRLVQRRLGRRPVLVLMDRQAGSLAALESATRAAKVRLEHLHIRPSPDTPGMDSIELSLGGASPTVLLTLLDNLRALPGVQEITATAPRAPVAKSPSAGGAQESTA